MHLQQFILNIFLGIEFFFVRHFKIHKQRITFISLEADVLENDFQMIDALLDHNQYEIKTCLLFFKKNLWGQFKYFLNCLKQCYLINTSKVVLINDNNYVVTKFKRPEVKVIQVWHACGAIKKFGMDTKRKYPIKNYDYILSTSHFWKGPYKQAFNVDENQVLNLGMPRLGVLFDEGKMSAYKQYLYLKYPQLKGKRVILYAPTFRGNIYEGFKAIDLDLVSILNQLENTVCICKFHPQLGNHTMQQDERILYLNDENLYALFSISDVLISDYSSIIFDYMLLNRPLLLYVPDYDYYKEKRGYYVDPKDLYMPLCFNVSDVLHYLKTPYPIPYQKLKETYFDYIDGHHTKRVVEFIETLMK